MPSERENETRQIISDVMGSSVNWPANFKKVLPAWLEISQPAFHLNQLIGWQSHIGNNGAVPATSPLSLTTTPQVVTGMSTTLYSAGSYLITANMEASLVSASGNTGERSPTVAANVDNAGSPSWSSTSNALTENASGASSISANTTDYLVLDTFGFTVHPNATIDGIVARIVARVDIGGTSNWRSQLRKADVLAGTADSSTPNTSYSNESHGGSTDLWGTTWTVADITDAGFGIAVWGDEDFGVGRNFEVDYAGLTVYLSNLQDTVTGYLYVDGVAQSSTVAVDLSTVGTASSGSSTWFITTEADDIPIEFRAENAYGTDSTVTTNSELIIVRTA